VNYFFVCGAPKSGTTWLQRVLDAHPEVCCSGEGHFIERFSVPVAKVVRDYNEHINFVAHRVYEGKPYYEPMDQEAFDELMRAFIVGRLMTRRPGPEVRWLGDKTPRYTKHLKGLKRLFPDAKFINIVRDPRDVAMSRLHQAHRAGMGHLQDPGAPEAVEFVRAGGRDWMASVQPVTVFAEANPGRLHGLGYEAMIADPAAEARKLFAFLGVSTEARVIDEVVRTTSFEAQSGRKPGEEDPNSFMRKGVAGDWIGRLPPPALEALDEVCGDLMRQFGYA